MIPRHPNVRRTLNLTDAVHEGKQNPIKSAARHDRPAVRTVPLPRPQAERLLALADFLPLRDALLIRELFDRGRTIAHLARLLGESRWRIRTRINRLIARTADPAFAFVVSRRIGLAHRRGTHTPIISSAAPRWPDDWSDSLRIAAQLCVLDGLSCREAAAKSGMSCHTLRRHLATLRELGRLWRGNTLLREAS